MLGAGRKADRVTERKSARRRKGGGRGEEDNKVFLPAAGDGKVRCCAILHDRTLTKSDKITKGEAK